MSVQHDIPVEAITIIIIEQGISACDLMDGCSEELWKGPRSSCCSRQISCEGNAREGITLYNIYNYRKREMMREMLSMTQCLYTLATTLYSLTRSFDFFLSFLLFHSEREKKEKKKRSSRVVGKIPLLSFICSHFLLLSTKKRGHLYCVTHGGLSPTCFDWCYKVYMPLLHGWLMAEKKLYGAKGKWNGGCKRKCRGEMYHSTVEE